MAETLQNLGLGFSVALQPAVLLYAFVGCVVGTLVGVLPGVGPLAGISLLLPATFGLTATTAIMLLAPPLAGFALRFGPPEYFALLLLGLLVLAYMSGGSMVKSLAMAVLGLLLGMIGIDQMSGYFRFSYGIVELGDGLGVVPIAVGLFGIAEVLA